MPQQRFPALAQYAPWKRLLDIIMAMLGIILLLPLLVLLMLLVRCYLGSPVFYRQERPGLHARPFTIFKFRTMADRRNAAGELLPDAERMTGLGNVLRSSSLDELPELFNVLKGDMSLVGPRPLLVEYLPRYSAEQSRRHDVLPGITGWAQVNGRNGITWKEKFRHDVWYVDHQSFALDMKIIWMTLIKVVQREGISAAGYATMPLFLGDDEGKDQVF